MKKWPFLDRWSLRLLGALLLIASAVAVMGGVTVLIESLDFGIDWLWGLIFAFPIGSVIVIALVGFLYGLRLIFDADADE